MSRDAKHFLQGQGVRTENSFEKKPYPVSWLNLGTIGLPEADRLMEKMSSLRLKDKIQDTLLILSHKPVLTVGARKLNMDDLLQPLEEFEKKGVQFYQSNRGGGLTYHWPEQLVVYPILKLRKEEQHLANYMNRLEEVGIRTFSKLGIEVYRKRDKTAQIGLWHNDEKIASMGIFVSNWITRYGFALNLDGNLDPSRFIKPCGLDVKLTSAAQVLAREPKKDEVINLVKRNFEDVFNRKITQNIDKFELYNLLLFENTDSTFSNN